MTAASRLLNSWATPLAKVADRLQFLGLPQAGLQTLLFFLGAVAVRDIAKKGYKFSSIISLVYIDADLHVEQASILAAVSFFKTSRSVFPLFFAFGSTTIWGRIVGHPGR